MSEVLQRYRSVAHGFTTRVAGVGPDDWSKATPCSDWTVADLVAHVIATHHRVLATLDEREPVAVDRESDLVRQWRPATVAITEALGDEVRAAKTMSGMFGEQSFASLVGRLLCSDTLLHTWDLARATGQDESLAIDAVTKALESLTPLDEGLRRPGGFAPRIVSAPGADLQTQLLNFCGRSCAPL
jgi:uncharacterized protein (TIGR03086 family)